MSTLMSEKFEVLGMKRRHYEFATAVMVFQKLGESRQLAHELVDATYDRLERMPGMGRDELAAVESQNVPAQTRQPVEGDGGQYRVVSRETAAGVPPSPSSTPDREGHQTVAGDRSHSGTAIPVREPTLQQRSSSANVKNAISITVLDTFRVRDGRGIGDVRIGELERLRTADVIEASVILQIQRKAVASSDARVRDVIKPSELQRMIQKAAEVADAQ